MRIRLEFERKGELPFSPMLYRKGLMRAENKTEATAETRDSREKTENDARSNNDTDFDNCFKETKWMISQRKCAYCKVRPRESSDHSPPKCLLLWPPSSAVKVLTIPSCLRCNRTTSWQENLVFVLLALVGRHPVLAEYCALGGKVERALARDQLLRTTLEACRNDAGHYTFTGDVHAAFDRVLRKTAQGLFYGLYDRVARIEKFELLSIEHRDFCSPEEVVSRLRRPAVRDITNEPLPSLTSRGLPNVFVIQAVTTNPRTGESQVLQHVFQDLRQDDVEWVVYQEETLRFTFFENDAGNAICVMDLWNTLIVAVKAPWPNQRGVLRRGRKNLNARR